ncbi:hypothetical protein I3843_09G189300 [Carya illinoinensis]|nr:hypothetical protein I3843_09G189300 [Carya illinoinensis]
MPSFGSPNYPSPMQAEQGHHHPGMRNVRVTKRYTKWGSLGDSSVQNHEVAIYS